MSGTKNFTEKEFACKCCGKNITSQKVIDMCQAIRDAIGYPIRVSSGTRCEKHNAEVGGEKNSNHVKGLAADLVCASTGAKRLFSVIADMKARGRLPELSYAILYTQKDFVHIDCGAARTKYFEIR